MLITDKELEKIKSKAFDHTSQSWFWIEDNKIFMFFTDYLTYDLIGNIEDFNSTDDVLKTIMKKQI